MPILVGFSGLMIGCAIFFAIHAIRHRQPLYWVFLLFVFPGLGSLVYFFAVYYPQSKVQVGVNRALNKAVSELNRGKNLQAARDAFEFTPTAQRRLELADLLLDNDLPEEALAHYEQCLTGIYAEDMNIRFSAAKAAFESARYDCGLKHLETIRQKAPDFNPEKILVLIGQGLWMAQRYEERDRFFTQQLKMLDTFDARVVYALWAQEKQLPEAKNLADSIENTIKRWSKINKQMNKEMLAYWQKTNTL
ncbi:hypothetical protein VQ643_00330 [Pseudomonas sp. F1_0610]|uniref:hypothetical protein n=1 Tax=Pseudomonas sp. F1_0610 TaxID=3114284 RepID=UPI0039C4A21C